MYAIIRTGGKQYKVEAGDEILVEKLDAEVGAEVAFEVLMLCGDEVVVGKPVVEGVTAKATVVDQVKGKKVVVFHYKPKKNIRKKQGHRQPYTKVKIEKIHKTARKAGAEAEEAVESHIEPKEGAEQNAQ